MRAQTARSTPSTFFRHRILNSPSTPKIKPSEIFQYEKSCSRTEMPNKYKIVMVPKVAIEDIYAKKNLPSDIEKTTAETDKVREVSPMHSNDRNFYYSEKNEILSIDEFLGVHKKLEIFRKRQDKIKLRNKLEDKAAKIEEMRCITGPTDRLFSARSIDSILHKVDVYSVRPQSSQVHFRSFDEKHSVSPEADLQKKSHLNVSAIHRRKVSLQNTEGSNNLLQSPSSKASPERKTNEFGFLKPKPPKNMAIEQKFTAKAINKHLFHMTVSPKRPKAIPFASLKELNYLKMFSSPRVMDHAVEHCIRKGRKLNMMENKEKGPAASSRNELKAEEETENHTNNTFMMNTFMTQSPQTVRPGEKSLGIRIEESIINIDNLLKKSTLGTPHQDNNKEKEKPKQVYNNRFLPLKLKSENKVPLRTSFKQNNHIKEIIEEHLALSRKIKDLNKIYKREYGPSGMNSQAYSSYYH